MSRYYRLCVEFKLIKLKEVKKLVCEEFGWTEEDSVEFEGSNKHSGYLICDGYLCGGQSEEEEHNLIYKGLKKLKPACKIRTRFTYMEDLPYEEYGDDFTNEDDFYKEIERSN